METVYYSGCNYYINSGTNPAEPKGTATAMHECVGCECLEFCCVKQTQEVFVCDEVVLAQGLRATRDKAKELEVL